MTNIDMCDFWKCLKTHIDDWKKYKVSYTYTVVVSRQLMHIKNTPL